MKTRSTCSRAHHGAIIVKDDTPVSWGYNGSPRGTRHCDHSRRCGACNGHAHDEQGTFCHVMPCPKAGHFPEVGDMENGHCARAVHAEVNALLNAARGGGSTVGATMYVTGTPCYGCARAIINAGITRVVWDGDYRPDERALAILEEAGVNVN